MTNKIVNLATIAETKEILEEAKASIEIIKKQVTDVENNIGRSISFLDSILEMCEDESGVIPESHDVEASPDTAVVSENRHKLVARPQISEVREAKKEPKKEPKRISNKNIPIDLPVDVDDINWSQAIPESAIVKTDSQKWARANTILTKFEAMQGPVLDFGCGGGHTTVAIYDQGIKTIGYDIKQDELWNKLNSDRLGLFTSNWEDVVGKGPFKSVLLHDVIDHIEQESIADVMNKIHEVIVPNGRVYAMVHPFSSRHGGHLYEYVNKAYYHLLLTENEIMEKYDNIPPNQRIIKPQGQYQKHFAEKFSIVGKKVSTQTLEPWIIKNLLPTIAEKWYPELDIDRVEKVLHISGIYYTLKKLPSSV